MNGRDLSAKVKMNLKKSVEGLKKVGVTPALAVILVGDDEASKVYVRNKHRAAEKIGIKTIDETMPADSKQEDVIKMIEKYNNDPDVHGILVQMPLPKHIDEKAHKELTGHTNQNILEFAKYLSDIQKPVWIRHVLVPTINTDEVYLKRLHQFVAQLKNVERVEVLPYHTLGAYKWKELGLEYPLEGIPTPSDQQLQIANTILETGK